MKKRILVGILLIVLVGLAMELKVWINRADAQVEMSTATIAPSRFIQPVRYLYVYDASRYVWQGNMVKGTMIWTMVGYIDSLNVTVLKIDTLK